MKIRIRKHLCHPCAIILFFSLLLRVGSATAADSTSHKPIFTTIGDDISLVWSDVGPFFIRPLQFDGTDWRNAAIVVGGTAALMPLDSSGRHAARTSSQASGFQNVMNASTHYGDIYGIAAASGITYLGGLIFQCDDLRTTGRELIETLALAGATTTVLKYIAGRSRPYADRGAFSFQPFAFSDDYHSLPSGHATVAFCISSVLAERISNPIATVLLYGAAASTAFSRMYHDQHWLSDTFFGAAIATTTGLWVTKRDEERDFGKKKPSDSGLLLAPSVGGISLTYKF
ncbi:MAG TPA: phosphatase PAP2 family protein [Candidatus Kapabacteria bacterium]|nr:phosphatase PAP2 family protein [Candidatus Kapabacteria bacterium]